MNKIRTIEKSLSCFRWGLAGLIPVLGLFFGAIAIVRWKQARNATGGKGNPYIVEKLARDFGKQSGNATSIEWNPARAYLRWGFVLACFGLLVSTAIVLVVSLVLILKEY